MRRQQRPLCRMWRSNFAGPKIRMKRNVWVYITDLGSSKIVGGNPWPGLLSSLRPVLCAPKSGLPSPTFYVFVHCQCAIRDLEVAMSCATNPDTIEQADIDCLGL